MNRKPLLFSLLAILFPLLAFADVYKWVDENGVVHYSEQPPPDQPCDEVDLRESGAPAATENRDAWAEEWLEQQRAKREEKRSMARAEREADALGREQNCAIARRTLSILELECPVLIDSEGVMHARCPNQPVWVPKGEIRWIDDAERAAMTEHYRAMLKDCEP